MIYLSPRWGFDVGRINDAIYLSRRWRLVAWRFAVSGCPGQTLRVQKIIRQYVKAPEGRQVHRKGMANNHRPQRKIYRSQIEKNFNIGENSINLIE